jgi:hypothetical protein
MQIETATFCRFPADRTSSGVFAARVVIPVDEFARLGLGNHERPSALPACFRWCHAAFGIGGSRWSVRLPEDAAAILYFAERQDALAFLARWAVATPAAQRLAA